MQWKRAWKPKTSNFRTLFTVLGLELNTLKDPRSRNSQWSPHFPNVVWGSLFKDSMFWILLGVCVPAAR